MLKKKNIADSVLWRSMRNISVPTLSSKYDSNLKTKTSKLAVNGEKSREITQALSVEKLKELAIFNSSETLFESQFLDTTR